MKRVLITGGNGMVGSSLTKRFIEKGYGVNWLIRKKTNHHQSGNVSCFFWNPEKSEIDITAFDNVDYIIHLAGANVAGKKWSNGYKKEILNSRIQSTQLLADTLIKNAISVQKIIGASAVGYYGMKTDDKIYSENDLPGNDFLSQVCCQWENGYEALMHHHFNVGILRLGLVLSANGGIYKRMKPLFRLGFGSTLGSGKQYMPWIHIDDLCNMIIYLSEHPIHNGVFNAVSDEMVTNYEFSKKLAQSLNAPFFMPNIPVWLLNGILGEQAYMLTTGLKISNEKIKSTGFSFRFLKLEDAFQDLKNK